MRTGTVILLVGFMLSTMLLAGLAFGSPADAPERLPQIFAAANAEYQRGDYAAARQSYIRILSAGGESGSVYYNLGNACFKQRKLGEAVFYWQKAQHYLPGDREIRENLDLANMMIVDRIETRTSPLGIRILTMLPGLLTITQESRLVLVLFVAANILLSLYLVAQNRRRARRALTGSIIVGFAFLLFASSLSWKLYDMNYRKKGVVVEQKVDVRSGPGMENMTVFTIHEGITVRVHEKANGWYQVSLPNGWNGWLPQHYLRIL